MMNWDQVETGNDNTYRWQRMAPHKSPAKLRQLSTYSMAKMVLRSEAFAERKKQESLRTLCEVLNDFFPQDLRTQVVKAVADGQEIEESQHLMSFLLLHLLTDVKHIGFTAGVNTGRCVQLEMEDSEQMLKVLEHKGKFKLESLQLDGVSMDSGLLSSILRRSPNIHTIQVSGELCSEVLHYLQDNPCGLRTLELTNCTVSDEEVVHALLGTRRDFRLLGEIICQGGDLTEGNTYGIQSQLTHLTIQSPLLTVCGAMVLMHSLRSLHHFDYSFWNSSVSHTLLFLNELARKALSFALTSLALFSPTKETIDNQVSLCPQLQKLMIECSDSTLLSLDSLSKFSKLSTLSLRYVSEELLISAVKAVGNKLRDLSVEFEEYTLHPISLETIKVIQEHCPHLQSLEMRNINIEAQPGDKLPSLTTTALAELQSLTLSNAFIQPKILERLFLGNSSLKTLALDVNQDALTDSVLAALLGNNKLKNLTSVYLGAGSVSAKAITSVMSLPSLSQLSLDLNRFPFIPVSTFTTLEDDLVKGNFQCVLKNVVQDD